MIAGLDCPNTNQVLQRLGISVVVSFYKSCYAFENSPQLFIIVILRYVFSTDEVPGLQRIVFCFNRTYHSRSDVIKVPKRKPEKLFQ